jgi:hypothetical protein
MALALPCTDLQSRHVKCIIVVSLPGAQAMPLHAEGRTQFPVPIIAEATVTPYTLAPMQRNTIHLQCMLCNCAA